MIELLLYCSYLRAVHWTYQQLNRIDDRTRRNLGKRIRRVCFALSVIRFSAARIAAVSRPLRRDSEQLHLEYLASYRDHADL